VEVKRGRAERDQQRYRYQAHTPAPRCRNAAGNIRFLQQLALLLEFQLAIIGFVQQAVGTLAIELGQTRFSNCNRRRAPIANIAPVA
jgi:hypothetical protein